MARLIGLLLFVVVLAFVAIAMGSWPAHQPKSVVATVSSSGQSEIVAFRDRSTLHVAEGTVGRDLVYPYAKDRGVVSV
jgi:hypothetical protein